MLLQLRQSIMISKEAERNFIFYGNNMIWQESFKELIEIEKRELCIKAR